MHPRYPFETIKKEIRFSGCCLTNINYDCMEMKFSGNPLSCDWSFLFFIFPESLIISLLMEIENLSNSGYDVRARMRMLCLCVRVHVRAGM